LEVSGVIPPFGLKAGVWSVVPGKLEVAGSGDSIVGAVLSTRPGWDKAGYEEGATEYEQAWSALPGMTSVPTIM
jgi:hypothetical protein